jgi:hypothetical protein
MQPPRNELQRDALVLARHLPFIAGAITVALLVAILSGFIIGSGYKGSAIVQVQLNVLPVPGVRQPVILDLARSPAVAEEAARNSSDGSLSSRVSIRERPEGLRVEATGGTQEEAISLANTWAEAIETVINATEVSPASAAALERESANALQQLEEADEALAAANTTGIEPSQEVLNEVSKSLADNQSELASLTRAAEVVRQTPNAPMAQLRIALAGLAVPQEVLGNVDNAQDLLQALELRRQVLEASVQQLTRQLNDLQTQRRQLLPLLLEREAAQNNYREAVRILHAAQLGPITARISQPAERAGGAGLSWPIRLGAAAAFGIVVGIVGAFALDSLPALRSRTGTPEEAKSPN